MSFRPGAAALTALACFTAPGPALAQEKPYVERVEVNVRTVLVRITGLNGKAPSPPPAPQDIEVLEDGAPMRVLGVDPVRPPSAPPSAPQPVPGAPVREAGAAPPASNGIPQHLYVDTTLLQINSVERLAEAFERNLDTVLANGPLEIVVADLEPRQTLQSTRDRETVRRALRDLGHGVSGKQSLILLRQQTLDDLRSGFTMNPEMEIRIAAEQEIRIIRDSLDRLLRWAASLGGQRPDVVYFAADGFDSDVTETYRRVLLQRSTSSPLVAAPKPPDQAAVELQLEYAAKGGELVGLAARSIAALGVEAVPIALGANLKDFGNDASTAGQDLFRASFGAVPLFAEPISPLRILAETTGGEVVTSASHLPAVLDAYEGSFVVSFRSEHPPDGKMHDLRITSLRPGLSARGPQYLTEGTPDSVALGLTVRALHEPVVEGGLPVRLSIDGVARNGKTFSGTLHVDADLASLVSTLDRLDGGRMRVTMAVEVEGAREPFTTKQEFDVPRGQAGWGADIPIGWPKKARRVAVTVEELKTGARGTGSTDIPRTE